MQDQIKKSIPGFVFAVLCWLVALGFILWVCPTAAWEGPAEQATDALTPRPSLQLFSLCCRRVYWRNWRLYDGIKDVDGERLQRRCVWVLTGRMCKPTLL